MSEFKKFVPEIVPISGFNPLKKNGSPMRQVMMGGNLTQANVVSGRTRKRIRGGYEREHAKATWSHKFDKDVVVLAVIPKYAPHWLKKGAVNPFDLIIYEDYETKELGCMEMRRYHSMHQHYGFNYEVDEELLDDLRMRPGTRISKDTVVARSPNVTPDGDYMIGLEANVIFVSHEATGEDGYIYSQSYAERTRAKGIETRTFGFGRTHYPCNWNGNQDVFKVIPDIGETIRNNGLLALLRPFDPILDPIYMTDRKLMTPCYGMDEPIYGIAGAKVIDVRVLHNPKSADKGLPPEFSEQLRWYHQAETEFYMAVIKETLGRTGRKLSDRVNLHPDLWAYVYDGICYCGKELVDAGLWPEDDIERLQLQRGYRGDALEEWRVEVTFQYDSAIGEGPKGTNMSGSKGVVVKVWPDENMFVDEFGNRADVAMFGGSTAGRMVPSQVNEQLIGAAGRDVIKRVRRRFSYGDFSVLRFEDIHARLLSEPEHVVREAYDYVLGFYKIVSKTVDYPRAVELLSRPNKRWIKHLAHVIEDGNEPYGMHIRYPIDGPGSEEINEAIIHSEYCPEMSTVRYKSPEATEYTQTLAKILIGPNYFFSLEKTATDGSGVSSAKLGHFGTTSKLTQGDKFSKPGRETSTKATDEATFRNLAKSIGGDNLAYLAAIHNDPALHEEICDTLLNAPNVADIECIIDPDNMGGTGHRPLNYIMHMHACSGKGFSDE